MIRQIYIIDRNVYINIETFICRKHEFKIANIYRCYLCNKYGKHLSESIDKINRRIDIYLSTDHKLQSFVQNFPFHMLLVKINIVILSVVRS